MTIVTLEQIKQQLNFTAALGAVDDALLARKIDAAQGHVERLLGFQIETRFPPEGDPPVSTVPSALVECVCQLAAWWYENRETVNVGNVNEVPFGVTAIVREYQDWAF